MIKSLITGLAQKGAVNIGTLVAKYEEVCDDDLNKVCFYTKAKVKQKTANVSCVTFFRKTSSI